MKKHLTILGLLVVCTTFSFSQQRWYVDKSASGQENGKSWEDAFTHLEDALSQACSNDTIWVAAGTYKPNDSDPSNTNRRNYYPVFSDMALFGGFSGSESKLSERDLAANPTVLSGNIGDESVQTDNLLHIFNFADLADSISVTIDGFTIQEVYTDKYTMMGSTSYKGGAILTNKFLKLQINNCRIHSNYSENHGSGISLISGTQATLSNCRFESNVSFGFGNSIYCEADDVRIEKCVFESDSTAGWGGSVVLAGAAVIDSCTFSNNVSVDGGGAVYCKSKNFEIRHSSFYNNTCHNYEGGAISVRNDNAGIISNCKFKGNNALDYSTGGAIGIDGSSPVIVNCLFDSNNAHQGGAIYGYSSPAEIVGATVVNNTTRESNGYAIHFYMGGSATLTNSVVWNNGGEVKESYINVYNSAIMNGYSGGSNIISLSQQNSDPSGPNFVDPTNEKYRLTSASPLIDEGQENTHYSPVDLGGNPRKSGISCNDLIYDIGAFEYFADGLVHDPFTQQSMNGRIIKENEPLVLKADSLQSGSMTTTWYHNNSYLQEGTRLEIANFSAADTGMYYFTNQTSCGTKHSDTIHLAMPVDIQIHNQPQDKYARKNTNVQLQVDAKGNDLGYYWFKNGKRLCSKNKPSFSLDSVSGADQGTYYCNVYSPYLSVNSDTVQLSVFTKDTNHVSICSGDSILVQGSYLKSTGIYRDTLTGQQGADSIIITDLTVHDSYHFKEQASLCVEDSLYFADQYIKHSGIYYDSLQTVNGCDSVYQLNVTMHDTFRTDYSVSMCEGDSVQIAGSYRKQAGIYTDSLQTIHGCDSLIVTSLEVKEHTSTTVNPSICEGDSIFAGGAWQFTEGTYYDTLQAANSCDSVVITQLTVNPSYTKEIEKTIQEDESYFAGGKEQTTSGVYYDTLSSVHDCDSIIITYLTVEEDQEPTNLPGSHERSAVKIYPNPAGNRLYIETSRLLPDKIVVMDLLGHVIKQKNNSKTKHELDLSDLSPGIYLVSIKTGNKELHYRIIKK